jgi:hypothetical protein
MQYTDDEIDRIQQKLRELFHFRKLAFDNVEHHLKGYNHFHTFTKTILNVSKFGVAPQYYVTFDYWRDNEPITKYLFEVRFGPTREELDEAARTAKSKEDKIRFFRDNSEIIMQIGIPVNSYRRLEFRYEYNQPDREYTLVMMFVLSHTPHVAEGKAARSRDEIIFVEISPINERTFNDMRPIIKELVEEREILADPFITG